MSTLALHLSSNAYICMYIAGVRFVCVQVKVEDTVVVVCDGVELLTHVPRTVEEIETTMKDNSSTVFLSSRSTWRLIGSS